MNIEEIRAKFPQYGDLSDGALVQALHKKYYSDIPYQKFEQEVFKTKPVQVGAEALPGYVKQEAQSRGVGEQALAGAGTALDQAALRLKQIVTGLTPQDEQQVQADRALASTPAGMVGNIGGNIAMTAVPGAALQTGLTSAAAKVLPAVVAPTVAAGATGAALAAGTNPVLKGESEVSNAALGAAGGVGGDLVSRGLARVFQPITQSDAVQKLTKEGVTPTPGQAAGGWLNRVEQKLESIPVIGDVISYARGRATKEFDEAAIRKALPAGTAEEIKAGRAGVERAGEIIDEAYNAAYGQITGKVKPDTTFLRNLGKIPAQEGLDLPPSLAERFDQLVKDRVVSKLAGEGADAEGLRAAQNSLGALARKYRASGDPDQRALGMAFNEAKGQLRELVSRQAAPEFKGTLDALDKNYSALLAVEKAAGYQGSREGVFSAEALKRASQKSTSSMRDLADTGADVLGRTVPDSGTAGRTLLPLMTYAISGSAAAGNEYLGGPAWLTGALAAPVIYSGLGSKYMIGGYPGQAPISQAIRSTAPYVSQLGRSIATQK